MILRAEQIFDKVYLDRENPSDFIKFVAEGIKRELINKLMDELDDHKIRIVELKEPEFIEDLPGSSWWEESAYKQDLVCLTFVQCKNCRMVYPWCQRFRDELGGNGFCPYGAEIIEKRAASCDREDTDCTVCFKESHCKALAKAERELK